MVSEIDRNYPMGLTIDGKQIHVSVKWAGTNCCLVLVGEQEEDQRFMMDPELRQGDVWNLTLEAERKIHGSLVYGFETEAGWMADPYGTRFTGREIWGDCSSLHKPMRTVADQEKFDWGEDRHPWVPYEDCVIYKAHVRGFTRHSSSHVRDRGTFRAMIEKIPHLKELGITTLELMPVTEFAEVREPAEIRHSSERQHVSELRHTEKTESLSTIHGAAETPLFTMNYWGYGESFLFAPKSSYSAGRRKRPDIELKMLVRELHKAGIELVLELYFTGKEEPSMVLDAVRSWAREYHLDGIHLVGDAPLKLIGEDPYLSRLKLWAEYWNGVNEGKRRHLGWYNDGFLRDMRCVLKGDDARLNSLAYRVRLNLENSAVINYMAGTNGFTLADMVSYNEKHNEANGEKNRDGTAENNSWNCGTEGPTRRKKVLELRKKQMQNSVLMLFLSQGTPLLLAGDEFGNSQSGNNNPYCQDNELSWLNWNQQKTNREFYEFVKRAIAFRKEHPVFHQAKPLLGMDSLGCGQPDISCHGLKAWQPQFEISCHQLSVMYCGEYGKKPDGSRDEDFLVIYNMHWEPHRFALPKLPRGRRWHLTVDTGRTEYSHFLENGQEPMLEEQMSYEAEPRTIVVLMGKAHPELDVIRKKTKRKERHREKV